MPFYKITVILKDRKTHTGIRQLDSHDIDYIYRTYLKKAEQHYRNDLVNFDVVMISKLSDAGRAFIEGQGRQQNDVFTSWQVPEIQESLGHPMSRKKEIDPGKTLGEKAK